MGWISPTGHNDPESDWTNPGRAYDDNESLYAFRGNLPGELELLHDALDCNKIRIMQFDYGVATAIDVYYEGDWHNIYSGSINEGDWFEISIPAGTKSVTKARIYSVGGGNSNIALYEFDFWELEDQAPSAPTSLECEEATNPAGITDLTPEFTAVLADPNSDDLTHVQILVNTTEAFDGVEMWDSGSVDIADCTSGQRCAAVSYAGTALALGGVKYYWKIRAYDGTAWGEYSAVANFTMDFVLLTGTSSVASSVAGDLILDVTFSGTSATASSVAQALLEVILSLSGTSAVISTLSSAILNVLLSFSGTAAAVSLAQAYMRLLRQYITGTVDLEHDNAIVTGIDTLWLEEIVAGDFLKKKNEDALYVVNSVDSDEQITLASKYVGDSASGAEYIIHRRFTTYHSLPLLSAKNDYHAGDTDWAELMRYNTRKIDYLLKSLE